MATLNASGTVWVISGRNGENLICIAGPTPDEAWWRACAQAEAVGMLGHPMLPTSPGGLDRQPDAPEPGDVMEPG